MSNLILSFKVTRQTFLSASYLTLIVASFGYSMAQTTTTPSDFGQGFDRVAPKTLPRNDAPASDNPGGPLPEAEGDTTPVTDKLAGIVFVGKQSLVKPDGIAVTGDKLGLDKLSIEGFTPPDEVGFRAIAAKAIGKPASVFSVNQLMRDLILHYRANNRPVVDIFLAEQAMQNSVIQIVVIEGHIGQIRAEGNKHFPSPLLTANIRSEPGQPIDSARLARDVAWINNNPFRQVDLVYAKGEEEGTTDIVLKTSDRFPLRSYVGFDDSGNDLTGDERFSLGVNWGNAFGLDHQFNYQYITSADLYAVRAHSASYVVPLPWRHTLTVFGSYGDTVAHGFDSNALSSTGYSWQASMRYNIPLGDVAFSEKQKLKQEVVLGYDYKEGNSQLLVSNVAATANNFTQTNQFSLGYNASLPDAWGSTTFTSTGFYSPGGLMSADNSDVYRTVGNGANASYVYGRLTLDRLTKLPADFTLSIRALYQVAGSRLLGGEQLGLGGFATVRGYDEREANGDDGYLLSTEIRTPAVALAKALGFDKAADQLQFLAFCDYGGVSNHNADSLPVVQGAQGPNETLLSVGPGMRYSISSYLTMRFDYGWQLSDTDISTQVRRDYNSRGHLSIVLSY